MDYVDKHEVKFCPILVSRLNFKKIPYKVNLPFEWFDVDEISTAFE